MAGAAAPSTSPTVRVSCLTPSDSVSVQVGANRLTPPLGSEVARMQAASCPGSTRFSAGSSSRQRGMTAGQRGANGHASGRLISDGGLPGIGRSGSRTVVSSRGSEPSRPSVYGILLSRNRTSAVAASTAFPAYMTMTRSAIPATTPRSWVMSISDAPSLSRAARSASSTWAWMVTSRAVVGSSAIITTGSLAIAIAITIRCRWPPENSCG